VISRADHQEGRRQSSHVTRASRRLAAQLNPFIPFPTRVIRNQNDVKVRLHPLVRRGDQPERLVAPADLQALTEKSLGPELPGLHPTRTIIIAGKDRRDPRRRHKNRILVAKEIHQIACHREVRLLLPRAAFVGGMKHLARFFEADSPPRYRFRPNNQNRSRSGGVRPRSLRSSQTTPTHPLIG